MTRLGYTKAQNYRSMLKHTVDIFGKDVICLTFMRRVWACANADQWDTVYDWTAKEHARATIKHQEPHLCACSLPNCDYYEGQMNARESAYLAECEDFDQMQREQDADYEHSDCRYSNGNGEALAI